MKLKNAPARKLARQIDATHGKHASTFPEFAEQLKFARAIATGAIEMTKPLPHAEVIKHMAEHGYESVEGRIDADDMEWTVAGRCWNPILNPDGAWRVKPQTVTIEIPKPTDVAVVFPYKALLTFTNAYDGDTALSAIKKAMRL